MLIHWKYFSEWEFSIYLIQINRYMKTKLILFVSAILFIASCKTGNFTSRRYMAGHYKSNHASVKKPEAIASKRHESSLKREKQNAVNETKETHVLIAANTGKKVVFTEKKHKHLTFSNTATKKAKSVVFKKAFEFLKPFTQKRSEPLRSGKSDEPVSTKSLIGFACGIGGIAIDIIAFIAAVASLNYGVLLLMIVGLVLGILGIVFGTQGIKDYKSSRNTPTLVFGIVGAATGLAAIILAIYLGLYGALLIAAYSI